MRRSVWWLFTTARNRDAGGERVCFDDRAR
jgi:hypothetical protein